MQSINYNTGLSKAEKWADLQIKQHQNNFEQWTDFKQVFKNRFITFNKVEEAIQELNKLKVKNQKYNKYINIFQILVRQAKITEYNILILYFL